jgi:hypothetical protein
VSDKKGTLCSSVHVCVIIVKCFQHESKPSAVRLFSSMRVCWGRRRLVRLTKKS